MTYFFLNTAKLQPANLRTAALARKAIEDDGLSEDAALQGDWGSCTLSYDIVEGGIAVIEISGAIASCHIPGWYWMANLTYENITATIEEAVNNAAVKGVLLRFNSPGGTVAGCAEAAALIDRFAEIKPIWAQCQMACSAGYWLASAANRIIVDPTGDVGSIGVICSHMDMSKMLEDWGIKVTMIFSGDRKADGNPYEPLSPEALKTIQGEMDYLRDIFVGDVAAMRGLADDAVRGTEALTFIGDLAIAQGLADGKGFFHDTLAEMTATLNPAGEAGSTLKKERTMAKKPLSPAARAAEDDKKKKPASAEDPAPGDDPEKKEGDDEDEAAAEGEDGESGEKKDAQTPGAQPAAATERARIAAIFKLPEAEGRASLAQHLALETDLTVSQAQSMLAASAKEAGGNVLALGMGTLKNPAIGPGATDTKKNALVEDMQRRFAKK